MLLDSKNTLGHKFNKRSLLCVALLVKWKAGETRDSDVEPMNGFQIVATVINI